MSAERDTFRPAMPPPPISAKSKGKQKATDDVPDDNEADPLAKRKRLACEICRVRRVKCVWNESEKSCVACLTAGYECSGEPTRKKRAKKGEIRDERLLELEAKLRQYDIGSALTFQLIERGFKHDPPAVPGLPTGFYKQYVLCAAFVAGAASFTDHTRIMGGEVSPDMPTERPSGCQHNFDSYAAFALSRSEAVLALAFQSRQIFEDSTLRHRPSPEAIYCLIAMDWMANLTREVVEVGGQSLGRSGPRTVVTKLDTEFLEIACRSYRTLLMGRRSEIEEEDLGLLLGPVNAHLFFLDARNAVLTGSKLVFREIDLAPIFPLAATACSTPLVDYTLLDPERDHCQELGKQILPLVYSTAVLYRKVARLSPSLCETTSLLEPIWTEIDLSQSNLALVSSSLPSLPPGDQPQSLRYELEGIVQTQQLHLAQLDLLVHQKILQAFVQPSDPVTAVSSAPTPNLLEAYTASKFRLRNAVRLIVAVAQTAIATMSLRRARHVVEVLSVCSAWTSLGRIEEDILARVELLKELDITLEMGLVLEQCLALVAWSSPTAAAQRTGLLLTLVSAFGPVPANTLPSPPTTLPPAPKPPPAPVHQVPESFTTSGSDNREDDFELDLSFLDDFARERGLPIETESPDDFAAFLSATAEWTPMSLDPVSTASGVTAMSLDSPVTHVDPNL
ncbi:hypothetical protein JCM3766R1_005602 [Sporobolomyces carnicolor]